MKLSKGRPLVNYLAVATALSVLGLTGCAGATRLPMRSRGPAGENLENHLDLKFLDESGRHVEEVRQRLGAIDTGYANPRLFWGRWSESKWGWWVVAAAPGGAAGDARRVWRVHNLLIRFDENGLLQERKLIDEDSALWRELHTRLAEAPPLDLAQPVTIAGSGSACCGVTEMLLARDSLRVTTRRKKNPAVEISPQMVVRISHSRVPDKGSSVGITCHTLHLSEKTAIGKRVSFCADPTSIAKMFQYLQQSAPGNLLWE